MCAAQHSFIIRRVSPERAANALKFHLENLTEHLWPRTNDEFKEFANDGRLFEAVNVAEEKETIVGVCYVTLSDEDSEDGEFGGVYISFRFRIYDLATALGIVAISTFLVQERPKGRLLAHVHELNQKPLKLLEGLGFVYIDKVTIPNDEAPEGMPRNSVGELVGNVFELTVAGIHAFAQWIDSFDGTVRRGKAGTAPMAIDVLGFQPDARADLVAALRDFAGGK